jgi:hypothetical protein
MNSRHPAARRLLIYCLVFAGIGASAGIATFTIGVGLSGMSYEPTWYQLLHNILCWPNAILWFLIPDRMRSLHDVYWLTYWIGVPTLGWALLGIALNGIKRKIAKSSN